MPPRICAKDSNAFIQQNKMSMFFFFSKIHILFIYLKRHELSTIVRQQIFMLFQF